MNASVSGTKLVCRQGSERNIPPTPSWSIFKYMAELLRSLSALEEWVIFHSLLLPFI